MHESAPSPWCLKCISCGLVCASVALCSTSEIPVMAILSILGSWLIMCHFWINFFIMVIILQCFYIGLNSNLPNGRILMGSFGTDVYSFCMH